MSKDQSKKTPEASEKNSTTALIDQTLSLVKDFGGLASKFPTGSDYEYHTAFGDFETEVNDISRRTGALVNQCAKSHFSAPRLRKIIASSKGDGPSEELDGEGGTSNSLLAEKNTDALYVVVDSLFENIDTLLDDVKGLKMSNDVQMAAFTGNPKEGGAFAPISGETSAAGSSSQGGVIARPQIHFKRVPDNSYTPARPLLFKKKEGSDDEYEVTYGKPHEHPYKELIETYAFTPLQLSAKETGSETISVPLSSCPLHFVDTLDTLKEMISKLRFEAGCTEFALDLEHHSVHSFQGITCLAQVSTRTEDFLVDVLALRDDMHRMNEVLLDPRVLKVLHGCREDIRWLQKDFGCYVANVFDTGAALQALQMPFSLAFAVDHFCQVKLDKQYQLADWRRRPLSKEMVHYARLDTHYLLYIYDRLCTLLLNYGNSTNSFGGTQGGGARGNLLQYVLNVEGRRLCGLLYEKDSLDEKLSYRDGLGKAIVGMLPHQLEICRRVFNFRDAVAREEDESPAAIMHPSSIVRLAVKAPTSAAGILRAFQPSVVSIAIRSRLKDLVSIMEDVANTVPITEGKAQSGVKRQREDEAALMKHESSSLVEGTGVSLRRKFTQYSPLTGTLPSCCDDDCDETTATQVSPFKGSAKVVPLLSNCTASSFSTFVSALTAKVQPPAPARFFSGAKKSAAENHKASVVEKLAASVAAKEDDEEGGALDEDLIKIPPKEVQPDAEEEEPEQPQEKTQEEKEKEAGAVSLRQAFGGGAGSKKAGSKGTKAQQAISAAKKK